MLRLRQIVRQYLARRLEAPNILFALERLNVAGFSPKNIFDVGAYRGEFAMMCRAIWPKAKIACFEPLEHRVSELKELAKQNAGLEVFQCLLGATAEKSIPLHVSETASSVLSERVEQDFPVRNYPMRTIDEIVTTHFDGEAPEFIKIDVQGYELEVLKGGEKSLMGICGILAEINLLDIHQGVPLLAEVVAWLYERDWVAYDICGLTRRPLDRALWQADFVFLPKSSNLRADKRWTS